MQNFYYNILIEDGQYYEPFISAKNGILTYHTSFEEEGIYITSEQASNILEEVGLKSKFINWSILDDYELECQKLFDLFKKTSFELENICKVAIEKENDPVEALKKLNNLIPIYYSESDINISSPTFEEIYNPYVLIINKSKISIVIKYYNLSNNYKYQSESKKVKNIFLNSEKDKYLSISKEGILQINYPFFEEPSLITILEAKEELKEAGKDIYNFFSLEDYDHNAQLIYDWFKYTPKEMKNLCKIAFTMNIDLVSLFKRENENVSVYYTECIFIDS